MAFGRGFAMAKKSAGIPVLVGLALALSITASTAQPLPDGGDDVLQPLVDLPEPGAPLFSFDFSEIEEQEGCAGSVNTTNVECLLVSEAMEEDAQEGVQAFSFGVIALGGTISGISTETSDARRAFWGGFEIAEVIDAVWEEGDCVLEPCPPVLVRPAGAICIMARPFEQAVTLPANGTVSLASLTIVSVIEAEAGLACVELRENLSEVEGSLEIEEDRVDELRIRRNTIRSRASLAESGLGEIRDELSGNCLLRFIDGPFEELPPEPGRRRVPPLPCWDALAENIEIDGVIEIIQDPLFFDEFEPANEAGDDLGPVGQAPVACARLEAELADADVLVEDRAEELEQVSAEIGRLQAQRALRAEEIEALQQRIAEIEVLIADRRAALDRAISELRSALVQRDAAQDRFLDAMNDLDRNRAQIDDLDELLNQLGAANGGGAGIACVFGMDFNIQLDPGLAEALDGLQDVDFDNLDNWEDFNGPVTPDNAGLLARREILLRDNRALQAALESAFADFQRKQDAVIEANDARLQVFDELNAAHDERVDAIVALRALVAQQGGDAFRIEELQAVGTSLEGEIDELETVAALLGERLIDCRRDPCGECLSLGEEFRATQSQQAGLLQQLENIEEEFQAAVAARNLLHSEITEMVAEVWRCEQAIEPAGAGAGVLPVPGSPDELPEMVAGRNVAEVEIRYIDDLVMNGLSAIGDPVVAPLELVDDRLDLAAVLNGRVEDDFLPRLARTDIVIRNEVTWNDRTYFPGLETARYSIAAISGQLPAPTGLRAESRSSTVLLDWDDVDGVMIYTVRRDGLIIAKGLTPSFYLDGSVENGVTYSYTVSASDVCGEGRRSAVVDIEAIGEEVGIGPFRRGDSNGDGSIHISDGIFTLSYLFLGNDEPGCQAAADSNRDGNVNISDPTYTLVFLFGGGAVHPEPTTCANSGDWGDVVQGCDTPTCN